MTTHLEDPIGNELPPTPKEREIAGGRAASVQALRVPSPVSGREIDGREGPEPTRFGDWELRGRCIDF